MKSNTSKKIERCQAITFALKRIGGANAAGKERYYATMGHYTDEYSRASIDILGEERKILDLGISPAIAKPAVSAIIDLMVKEALTDGITRRFGDLFEVRVDIAGSFSRIDEPYDATKHHLRVNLVPLKALSSAYYRAEPPVNVRRQPQGRIDHVTYPGGEKGEVKVGEDIIIRGRELYLNQGDTVTLKWEAPDGQSERSTIGNFADLDQFILVNTPGELRLKWFAGEASDIAVKPGTMPKLYVNTKAHARSATARGTASEVKILE